MISSGRVAAIATVALSAGFVAGAWFISSGYGYTLLPVPKLPPSPTPAARTKSIRRAPGLEAVGVPRQAHFSVGLWGLMPTAERTDLLPAPGCFWEVEPRPFQPGHSWQKTDPDRAIGGYSATDPATGGFRYLLVQSTRNAAAELDLQVVFFDEAANRMVPRSRPLSASEGSGAVFTMTEFYFEPFQRLELSKAAYFAIERVVPDASRLLAKATQQEAKEKGVAILLPPILGQPYPFDLTDVDGKPIHSADFKGKAVLVTIAGPSTYGLTNFGLMMTRKLRESNAPNELAFVTVSFDASVQDAKESFGKLGLDGPLIVLPNDPATRRLWVDGSRIDQLPKFFLIDREGVLRNLCQGRELKDRVDVLLGRAVRPPSGTIPPGHPATN